MIVLLTSFFAVVSPNSFGLFFNRGVELLLFLLLKVFVWNDNRLIITMMEAVYTANEDHLIMKVGEMTFLWVTKRVKEF